MKFMEKKLNEKKISELESTIQSRDTSHARY
jgi:hypothetical protein